MHRRHDDPPPPTIGQLATRAPRWVHAWCDGCGHHGALPLIPFLIRWGPAAPSDRLRAALRCPRCGRRGGSITLPSMMGSQGPEPFPTTDRT
ncbi:hypothetical protein [Parvibaculum sp. MBR-TMA-1.3b-4.2]|jgi:hypothetical protein